MNFSSMEYFEVLAQERNFTRAAERLHMTQQSLSSHIAGMEKELGCQLLVRRVPLELTYAGEVMLRYASRFHKEHETLLREFCDISQNQKGVLRVGAAATRGQILLPEIIASFQKKYPNIRLDLTEASNDILQQELLKGTIDIAIADFPKSLPGIVLQEFYYEETVLLLEKEFFALSFGAESGKYMRQFAESDFTALKTCPLVLGSMDDVDGRIGSEVLKRFGIDEPVIRVRSHNVGTLLKLALYGAGGCFCPKNIVQTALTEKQKNSVLMFSLGEKAGYPIRFGYKDSACQWSVIEEFMNCARRAIT